MQNEEYVQVNAWDTLSANMLLGVCVESIEFNQHL